MRDRVGHGRVRLARVVLAGIITAVGVGSTPLVDARVEVAQPAVRPARVAPAATAAPFEALRTRLRVVPAATVAAPVAAAEELAAPVAPVGGDVQPGRARPVEVAITPPPAEGFGAVASAAQAPPVALESARDDGTAPSGGTWALLVGIDDYPGIRYDLRSAVNDINDVDEALRRMGVTADRRMVLRDGQATADVIRSGVDWLTAHAGPDATMVLFFAGHVQKLEPGREALVGADGKTVSDVELASMLDRSPASRAWIGIAACYSGGFDEVVRPGRILTAAAPADAPAYENERFDRSYLVEYMVRRAMLGAGITTVEAAFARALEDLRRDYPERTPVQIDRFEGNLDLAQGRPSPAPAPKPAETPPPTSSPPPTTTPPGDKDKEGCSQLTLGVVRCGR